MGHRDDAGVAFDHDDRRTVIVEGTLHAPTDELDVEADGRLKHRWPCVIALELDRQLDHGVDIGRRRCSNRGRAAGGVLVRGHGDDAIDLIDAELEPDEGLDGTCVLRQHRQGVVGDTGRDEVC